MRPRKEKAGGHTLGELPGFPMPQFLCLLNDSSSAVHPGLLRCYDLLSSSKNVLKEHFVNIMYVLRISTVWWPRRNQRGLERLSLQKALSQKKKEEHDKLPFRRLGSENKSTFVLFPNYTNPHLPEDLSSYSLPLVPPPAVGLRRSPSSWRDRSGWVVLVLRSEQRHSYLVSPQC